MLPRCPSVRFKHMISLHSQKNVRANETNLRTPTGSYPSYLYSTHTAIAKHLPSTQPSLKQDKTSKSRAASLGNLSFKHWSPTQTSHQKSVPHPFSTFLLKALDKSKHFFFKSLPILKIPLQTAVGKDCLQVLKFTSSP